MITIQMRQPIDELGKDFDEDLGEFVMFMEEHNPTLFYRITIHEYPTFIINHDDLACLDNFNDIEEERCTIVCF